MPLFYVRHTRTKTETRTRPRVATYQTPHKGDDDPPDANVHLLTLHWRGGHVYSTLIKSGWGKWTCEGWLAKKCGWGLILITHLLILPVGFFFLMNTHSHHCMDSGQIHSVGFGTRPWISERAESNLRKTL